MNEKTYSDWYNYSISDSDDFWLEKAKEFISWSEEPTIGQEGSMSERNYSWFSDGKLNVSYNCIDRHVNNGRGNHNAIIWEGNDENSLTITYDELLINVSKFSNLLKAQGIKKGEKVCIYMPMIPEAIYAMLACARIGAVHTVVFGGFSSEALVSRILDSECVAIITADVIKRGNKTIPLKKKVDEAIEKCPTVSTIITVSTYTEFSQTTKYDIDYNTAVILMSDICEPLPMNSEDPLFILYTSGSTGKPKGVLHTTGGYILYASITHKYIFDYHTNEVYWCTADIGWITGHSYVVYGPLANGATTLVFEGVPTFPTPARYWEIVDKHEVNIIYSTPTTIRSLMAQGDEYVQSTSRKSLRILGSVGEPINPEAWRWYSKVIGRNTCPIMDTWWQTETGGIAISPLPCSSNLKPGFATQPFFGITPVIINEEGEELFGETEGILVLKGSWPGQLRSLYNDKERFAETYLNKYPGYYLTGDGVKRDSDGALAITGRIDDTLNISGRLLGTAEIESALILHKDVSEAAAVATSHPVKGWSISSFVTLNNGTEEKPRLKEELVDIVSREIGSYAKPDKIYCVESLPKTRSGKIMRRIIREISNGNISGFGDTSTLSNPEAVGQIIRKLGLES